jgi:hypothetical protein|tara:strand:+ start:11484 stop:11774 length:291 start_codon:yes stop_codon:yes gene_type:complete
MLGSDDNFDPDDLPEFSLPESLLDQLFEFTGGANGNKGFMLIYTDQNGRPMVYTKTDAQIVEMGLRKAMEKYLIEVEGVEGMLNLRDEDEGEERLD